MNCRKTLPRCDVHAGTRPTDAVAHNLMQMDRRPARQLLAGDHHEKNKTRTRLHPRWTQPAVVVGRSARGRGQHLLRGARHRGQLHRRAGHGRHEHRHDPRPASGGARAALRRHGQGLPAAQVAGYRRPVDRRGALAVGQGHQVGGGLGLAGKTRARPAPRTDGGDLPLLPGTARPGRDHRRMGLLRLRRACRDRAHQAFSVSPLRADPPRDGGGVSGAGGARRGAAALQLLGQPDRHPDGHPDGRRQLRRGAVAGRPYRSHTPRRRQHRHRGAAPRQSGAGSRPAPGFALARP